MTDDNLLAKIQQKRSRSTVNREDPLLPTEGGVEVVKSFNCQEYSDELSSDSIEAAIKQLSDKLKIYPETKRRSGIVLDCSIDVELTDFCRAKGITLEVFIEAVWLELKEKNLDKIVKTAAKRLRTRKEVGAIRKQITELKKLI